MYNYLYIKQFYSFRDFSKASFCIYLRYSSVSIEYFWSLIPSGLAYIKRRITVDRVGWEDAQKFFLRSYTHSVIHCNFKKKIQLMTDMFLFFIYHDFFRSLAPRYFKHLRQKYLVSLICWSYISIFYIFVTLFSKKTSIVNHILTLSTPTITCDSKKKDKNYIFDKILLTVSFFLLNHKTTV